MLRAIFYARFHPSRGPCIIHKHPNDFVIASRPADSSASKAQITWSEISPYIIPPYELCNRPLSVRNNGYIILGFPVSLERDRYPRNRFTFNVCFVLESEEDDHGDDTANIGPWEPLVRKTAHFFTALEEEDGVLLAEEHFKDLKWAGDEGYPTKITTDAAVGAGAGGVVYNLLEGILEDINAYGEACVRLNDLHVLNLRLFRSSRAAPRKVHAWEVPLLVRPLPSSEEWTWDLVLERIHPHINGVSHIQRIAELADVELKLVKKAVRELLYHERIVLLDLFHFQAVYMLTEAFSTFVKDDALQSECADYVSADPSTNPLAPASNLSTNGTTMTSVPKNQHSPSSPETVLSTTPAKPSVSKQALISLYRALSSPGQSLHSLVLTHQADLQNLDIRRLITFGVLKGFVRRLHRFALAVQTSTAVSSQEQSPGGGGLSYGTPDGDIAGAAGGVGAPILPTAKSSADAREAFDRAWRKAAMSSGWETPPSEPPIVGPHGLQGDGSGGAIVDGALGPGGDSTAEGLNGAKLHEEKLRKYLDGRHCLDQVCVEMHSNEKRIVEMLTRGRFGEVVFFCK